MISIDLLGSRVALPAGKIFNGDNAHELNHVYPPHFNSHKVVLGPGTRDEGDSQPEWSQNEVLQRVEKMFPAFSW